MQAKISLYLLSNSFGTNEHIFDLDSFDLLQVVDLVFLQLNPLISLIQQVVSEAV